LYGIFTSCPFTFLNENTGGGGMLVEVVERGRGAGQNKLISIIACV
jgi:hypothetical protein